MDGSTPHNIRHLLALAAMSLALATMPIAMHAAPITWGTATNTTGKAQLVEGSSNVLAFNGGSNATVTNAGASGTSSYTFTGGSYQDLNYTPSPSTKVFTGASSGAASTGDTNFDAILNTAAYSSGTSGVQTITGLIDGNNYQVQVFYNDQRNAYTGRVMTFGDGEASPQNVNLTSGSGNWGQFAVGIFTASGNTQSITHKTDGFSSVHLNAMLVVSAGSIPLPTLSTASNPVAAAFTVDVNFTETVSGLEESDFDVTNGSVTPASLSGSGDTWSIQITPTSNGDVSVSLPVNSVIDLDGENNQNLLSNTLVTTYIMPGSDQPDVTLSTTSNPVASPYTVDCVFDEAVSGLSLGDFLVTNGTASNLTGSGATYSLLITPAAAGAVTVVLPADSVTDTDGDGLMNRVSNTLLTTYRIPDYTTVVLYGKLFTPDTTYKIYLTFAEDVTGLTDSDFQVVNGTASGTTGSGRYYSTTITAASPGQVEVTLPAGAITDTGGDNVTNPASNTYTTQCTSDFGDTWTINDQASWIAATATTNNMSVANGLVEPTANTATFSSVIKTFPVKRKATTVSFLQSPVWENWTASSGNLGPSGAGDAPVFVPAGDNDYYFLGKGSTGGYHAWHSSNMVTWTHKGPVTAPVTGRWVTSAEYKDGLYYIYSDYKNDHTPHLFIDDDLSDGVPGTYMGAAFPRAAGEHGSDCSLIRNDDDGLFHLIYEDWSPIKARTHSWDSPLAGHTSSADGITGFVEGEHLPPIDERTTPTGTFGSYDHPNSPNIIYEIHTPEQDAYGDWTTIKIGSRFFMFCDFDPVGQSIRMARWSSDSIYGEFKFTGEMHSGHPDPSVGFAEGKFHLFTQQDTDYTSPGPWVEGVQARAGVDIDGNGSIDQWTAWQTISEQYDYTPGFIRVVTLTPAGLDLSGLPAGYGFQFDFSVDNTVVSGISPIMDKVEMAFAPLNFQQWANNANTPAVNSGDHNFNSIPNLVEFAIGQPLLLQVQPGDTFGLTVKKEALDDGYTVELQFSDDLEAWFPATTSTVDLKLLSTTVLGNGDQDLVFQVPASAAPRLFWRIAVD